MKTSLNQVDDKYTWTFEWEIEENEKPHGWFLLAADCALEQYNAKVCKVGGWGFFVGHNALRHRQNSYSL